MFTFKLSFNVLVVIPFTAWQNSNCMNINVLSLQAAHLKWMNASLGQRCSCTNTRSSLKLNCFVMCTCLKEQRGRGAETDRTGIRGYKRNVLYISIIYHEPLHRWMLFPLGRFCENRVKPGIRFSGKWTNGTGVRAYANHLYLHSGMNHRVSIGRMWI